MDAYSGVVVPSLPSFCNVVDYIEAQDAAAYWQSYLGGAEVVTDRVVGGLVVKDADRIMHPLISTVPCRVRFDDASTLSSQLKCVLTDRVATMEHPHASLTDVKRWSGIEGDLLDTLLVYQNLPGTKDDVLVTDYEEVRVQHGVQASMEYAFELIIAPAGSDVRRLATLLDAPLRQ
ncbi:hypothetical protein H310_13966 [Aphanomyces invadans]|uniref:Uncharacterized protein n=1 Tax=Aphanomyces invadans TaxID=157072 RepID=A0A024TDP0_9STRA|nr:hypothetical protein H310_13966 [Aphanomyces invadans]ETV91417.1 hypothetical protein H310_13966 [Aphanomyces invadans]|eukprot:XP_008879869.1 hypothetical protein H310_13966 [Aphanomyces invadans]